MKKFLILAGVLATAGCANNFVSQEERKALGMTGVPSLASGSKQNLAGAAADAFRLADAYYKAGIKTGIAQDSAAALILVGAGSVVSGSVAGASDTVLTERALAAVGLERVVARGFSKADIEAIFKGAETLNCIGTIATVWQVYLPNADARVAQVTYAFIQEARIGVREALVNDDPSYSTLKTAFDSVKIEGGTVGIERAGGGRRSATPQEVEAYFARLAGCLSKPSLQDNAKAKIEEAAAVAAAKEKAKK